MATAELTPRQQKARARYLEHREEHLDASSRAYYLSIGVENPPPRKPKLAPMTPEERRAHKTEYNRRWRAAKRVERPPKEPKPEKTPEEQRARRNELNRKRRAARKAAKENATEE